MNKKKVAVSILTAIVMTMSLTMAGFAKTTADSKMAQIKKAGVLIIGTSADYPPYEFHKVVNGKDKIVGFDIKIGNEIAKGLGVNVLYKDMNFDGLLAALVTNKVDMVIAGMNPSPERAKKVDFSKIYYKAIQVVVERTADKATYTTIDSLKGKTVGVQTGTTQEALAKDQMKDSTIKSLAKVTDLILELKNNKVDAIILERPVAASFVSKNSDLCIGSVSLNNENKGAAVAMKKNSPELVNNVNKVLDKLMKSNSIDKFVTEANNEVE